MCVYCLGVICQLFADFFLFCIWAVVLLASSHPVAFVQSKLSQDSKDNAATAEPPNPDPATPSPKAAAPSADAMTSDATTTSDTSASATSAVIEDFKVEPNHTSINPSDQVTFEPDQEQTINSDTLHALVEQLRPSPSPATSLEQIVIIRTVDSAEHNPSEQ